MHQVKPLMTKCFTYLHKQKSRKSVNIFIPVQWTKTIICIELDLFGTAQLYRKNANYNRVSQIVGQ